MKRVMPTKEWQEAFALFLERLKELVDGEYKAHYPNLTAPTWEAEYGLKNVRVVRVSNQRMVHCFVDMTNGDVLKAEGWKKPAPTPRGNIFSDMNGMEGVNAYGAEYL